ncbi:MAG: hypothetical protein IRY90_03800 [Actinomadura rubrobrunea]|nr:hypothetical protein [Actinomadura rubrobrunea]
MSPSASSPSQDHSKLCGNLNAFAAAAGPSFDLAAIGLLNETKQPSRKALDSYVSTILQFGTELMLLVPDHLRDDLQMVLDAAMVSAKKLKSDTPPGDAVAALTTDKVAAARKRIVDYRGPC